MKEGDLYKFDIMDIIVVVLKDCKIKAISSEGKPLPNTNIISYPPYLFKQRFKKLRQIRL